MNLRVLSLSIVLLAACAHPRQTGTCTPVGNAGDANALRALYMRDGLPLVIAGQSIMSCTCEHRRLAGGDENRQLAGGDENRRLAGGDENRRLAGGDENRRLAGGDENRRLAGGDENRRLAGGDETRRLAGGDENRRLAGDDENRRLAGGDERLTCHTESSCPGGYVVSGSLSLRVFEGEEIEPLLGRCVGGRRDLRSARLAPGSAASWAMLIRF